jgi:hypothetical protein
VRTAREGGSRSYLQRPRIVLGGEDGLERQPYGWGNARSRRVRQNGRYGSENGRSPAHGVRPGIRRKPKSVVEAVRGVRRAHSSYEARVTPCDSWPASARGPYRVKSLVDGARGPCSFRATEDLKAGGSRMEDRRFLRERPDTMWRGSNREIGGSLR